MIYTIYISHNICIIYIYLFICHGRESEVKWIWPTATQYTVLCLPAFSPELSGREADAGATVAKEGGVLPRFWWAKI